MNPASYGMHAFGLLIAFYFATLSLLSGWSFTWDQFSEFWYFLVPLGATGLVTFATQYQLEFFWVGLAFNAAGIAFIANKLRNATKEHAQCMHD